MFVLVQAILKLLASVMALGGWTQPSAHYLADSMTRDLYAPPQTPAVIRRIETDRPYVAITVDDFYTANYRWQAAAHILQEANAAHATLTLCPAGSGLDMYSRVAPGQATQLKQLFAQGSYELCDHTYSHPIMPRLGARGGVQAEVSDILRGQAAIKGFFGRDPSPIFRPPFGSWDMRTEQAAHLAGFSRTVTWSIDSGDSEGHEKPAQQLLANVACAGPGDIILMHANRRSSAAALPLIIQMLRGKGLEPVGLSKLLASGTPVYSYSPADMRRLATCRR